MGLRCTFRFTESNSVDAGSKPTGGEANPIDGATRAELAEIVRMIEARASMREKIAASGLPDFAKTHLYQRFDNLERFLESDVVAAIRDERDYLFRLYQNAIA